MAVLEENKSIYIRIFKLLKPYIKKISIIFFCIIASAGINTLLPLLSKQIMDNGLLKSNFDIVLKFSILTFVFVLFDQGIGLIETKYFSYVNSMFQYSLQKIAFKHILKLKLQYFNSTNFSEIMGNIGVDIGNIARVCDKGTFLVISQIFRIIGGLVGLLLIDWKLTIVVIFAVPIRYFTVKLLAKKRKAMFKQYLEYNRDYSSWYGDAISGIKEIKLWGIDRIKIREFINKQRSIVKISIKMAFIDKLNGFSENIAFQTIDSALYIFGAYIVFNKELSIGGLFAFLTYSTYVILPVSSIINIGYNFSNIMPCAKRFFEFLDLETEAVDTNENPVRLADCQTEGKIKFNNVSFSYKEGEKILNNINLEISPGEKIAVIGVNGSGKSTLVNLLLRFYKPQDGNIEIDGIDINTISLKDYRSLISVVSQDMYLFNTSIEDNINTYPIIDRSEIHKAAVESGAYQFIKKMPLMYKSEVGRNGAKLSGGQRQKIAMARAFARKSSKIIILDEATSNYDVKSETKVNDVLRCSFAKQAVIVISHKPDILEKVDRIIMIDKGSIVDVSNRKGMFGENGIYT